MPPEAAEAAQEAQLQKQAEAVRELLQPWEAESQAVVQWPKALEMDWLRRTLSLWPSRSTTEAQALSHMQQPREDMPVMPQAWPKYVFACCPVTPRAGSVSRRSF